MTSQSYEAQLTPEELNQIHTALSEPGPNLLKIQAEAPPWRNGPNAGSPPTLKTLYKIAAQLRAERLHAEFETTNELWQAAQAELLGQGACSAASSQAINQIFSLICQEIIQRTLYRDDSKNRISLLRLLVRYQHLLLEKARFQRMAVEKFEAWYQNGPAKQRLEELEKATYAQRIEALGYAIFGEDWRPLVTSPVGIPGLEPPSTNNQQPTTNNEAPVMTEALPPINEIDHCPSPMAHDTPDEPVSAATHPAPPSTNIQQPTTNPEPPPAVNSAPPPATHSTIQSSNDSTPSPAPAPEPPIGLPANMEWLLTTPEDDAKRNRQQATEPPPPPENAEPPPPNNPPPTSNSEDLSNAA